MICRESKAGAIASSFWRHGSSSAGRRRLNGAAAAILMSLTSCSPKFCLLERSAGFSITAKAPAMKASTAFCDPGGVWELRTMTGIGFRSMSNFRKVRPAMRGNSRSSVSTSTGKERRRSRAS